MYAIDPDLVIYLVLLFGAALVVGVVLVILEKNEPLNEGTAYRQIIRKIEQNQDND